MENSKITPKPASDRKHSNPVLNVLLNLRQTPEAKPEKIQKLSKSIRNNSYRIDYRKLADCIISSLLLGLIK